MTHVQLITLKRRKNSDYIGTLKSDPKHDPVLNLFKIIDLIEWKVEYVCTHIDRL